MQRSQHTPPPRTIGSRRRERTLFFIGYPSDQQSEPLLFFYTFCFLACFSFSFSTPLDSLCLSCAREKRTFFFSQFFNSAGKKGSSNILHHSPFNFFSSFPFVRKTPSCHCVQSTVNFNKNLTLWCFSGSGRGKEKREGKRI